MEAIKQLQEAGYRVSLDGGNIRCEKLKDSNPNPEKVNQLFKDIRNRKHEAVRYLKNNFSFERHIRSLIDEFNCQGVSLTDFPQSTRHRALLLETKVTAAANQGDRDGFMKLLKQWRECFH